MLAIVGMPLCLDGDMLDLNNLPDARINCCNLCHLKRPQCRQQQASSTESDHLQYFGMLAVFRLEDNMKQFSPQLWLKATDRGYMSHLTAPELRYRCLCWRTRSCSCWQETTEPFPRSFSASVRGIPADGAGVLRTEADTALLASTKLHKFAPWRASLQLLTVPTSVKHRFFFFPLKTFILNYQKKTL